MGYLKYSVVSSDFERNAIDNIVLRLELQSGIEINFLKKVENNVYLITTHVSSVSFAGHAKRSQLTKQFNSVSDNSYLVGYIDKRDGKSFYCIGHTGGKNVATIDPTDNSNSSTYIFEWV